MTDPPKKPSRGSPMTGIRLSPPTLALADDLIPWLATQIATSPTRSDVLREAIMIGLRELDALRKDGSSACK
jgi:hypothetical protein